jgi:hypothetical protein
MALEGIYLHTHMCVYIHMPYIHTYLAASGLEQVVRQQEEGGEIEEEVEKEDGEAHDGLFVCVCVCVCEG